MKAARRPVIVSDSFWRRHFDDGVDLSRATLRIDGVTHAIVGIMPPGFAFPGGTDIWTPREQYSRIPSRTAHNWMVVARLADDATLDAARAQATLTARRLKQQYGESTRMNDVAVIPLHDEVVGRVRPALFLLMASVVLLLGVAGANLATLLLARISARRRELALRTALGAKGALVLLPVIAESLIVALAGGLVGVVIAVVGIRGVRRLETTALPRLSDVDASGTVLAFGFVAAGVTAFVFAALAGWQAYRLDLDTATHLLRGLSPTSDAFLYLSRWSCRPPCRRRRLSPMCGVSSRR